MERHQSWPHVSFSGPDGFMHSETILLNATSLLPGPTHLSQVVLGVNKPLETWAVSALHSSPWQVLALAPGWSEIVHCLGCCCLQSHKSQRGGCILSSLHCSHSWTAWLGNRNAPDHREGYCSSRNPFFKVLSIFLKHHFKIKSIHSNITFTNSPDMMTSTLTLCFGSTRVTNTLCLQQTSNWEECTYSTAEPKPYCS